LKSSLKAIAEKQWETNKKSILLSDVAPILTKESGAVDYRTLLDGKSLKAFIKDTGEDNGYRLVEHPTQSAKIGLVPLDAKFEFATTATEKLPNKSDTFRKRENRAVALLEILATLPEEDLTQIIIPVSVFVKLLK
jgi:hypothetical protein